jgi:hypothetical protein
LAILGKGGALSKIRRFPKELQMAIQRTATTLGLDEDWFNASATELLRFGLPKGVVSRSTRHRKKYGPCLTDISLLKDCFEIYSASPSSILAMREVFPDDVGETSLFDSVLEHAPSIDD